MVVESQYWIVLRRPVLMEDEGQVTLVKQFTLRKDAEAWIAKQHDQYFKPKDYYVVEPVKHDNA